MSSEDSRDADDGSLPEGSAFEGSWLALREAVDHRSRAPELLPPLVHTWRQRGWSRIVDLGSGAGSNVRYLAPRLPSPQSWVLVDHDPDLLEDAALPPEASGAERVRGDLADEGIRALRDVDFVTGAALLDLVSEAWLRRVVQACAERECGALFTTIYDGTIAWAPTSAQGRDASTRPDANRDRADDAFIRGLINAHQTRDKGLGPALGPRAALEAHDLFEAAGYRTWLVPSPWHLGVEDQELAMALLDGWAGAALEERPAAGHRTRRWVERSRARIREGRWVLTVGHLDVLALPGSASPTTSGI
ncbi:MAG: class I SAM-dependent methyltransferase [Gemmatimonadota bacterium]|nr:class I SAM-dependent methyltransferase [Gemmatimonadota bacterium]